MLDYGYEFSKNLHGKLKDKVWAKVFVKENQRDDVLNVSISSWDDNDGIDFTFRIEEFSKRVLNGYTSEYAAYEILAKYRKFVFNRMENKYFINKETQ